MTKRIQNVFTSSLLKNYITRRLLKNGLKISKQTICQTIELDDAYPKMADSSEG